MTPRAQRPRTGGGRCLAFGLPTSNAPGMPANGGSRRWRPSCTPLLTRASSFNQHDYAAASLIVIDEAARVADELLAQCTPNACGIEWKAGRPLDSSAVTVPTPCVKIPRRMGSHRFFGRHSGFDPLRKLDEPKCCDRSMLNDERLA